ncbi:MAG TPA: PAS domain-containing sensor histidine kinase [Drouetiella sp.]
MKLRIWQKISILMLIPISFEIVATAVLVQVLNNTQKTAEQIDNTRNALTKFHASQNNFNNAGIDIATLGVYRPDGSPPEFERDRTRLMAARDGIVLAANIHPRVKEALSRAPQVFDNAIELSKKAERLYHDPTIPKMRKGSIMKNDVFELIMDGDPLLQRIVEIETSMDKIEASELEHSRFMIILAAVGAFLSSLLVSLFIGYLFYKSFGKRLLMIEQNAEKVAMGRALPPALTGGDEIDELDRTLHQAAEYVESLHEKEFAVLNKSTDVLCSIDDRFKIISIGESVEKSWYYSVSDILGRSLLAILPEPEISKVRQILSVKSASATELDFETELVCGDGATREFAWKASWSPRQNSYYCVARDISERKKIERAKQRLLAIASHDLRTPLMSVSANLSSLAMGRFGQLDEVLSNALNESEENLDKLMELIQSLLDLERMETTKANLELGCVSVLDVTSEAVNSMESKAKEAHVNLVNQGRDESIVADERRLVQVLTNLLQNAIEQSTPNQTVTVAVATNGDAVRILVHDQGPGIAPDEIDLVFEKYFQSRNSAQNQTKRNSLSLALAKVLTEAQKGMIGVTSERGKGSEFYVQLPKFKLNESEDT